jgi:hypothetical protein
MRALKQHCVVTVSLNGETDVYAVPIEDRVHACIGVANVEFTGTIERLAEFAEAFAAVVERLRAEPAMIETWASCGRVGHPNLITLPAR